MSNNNESTATMNAEFNGFVRDMKPYIIKHPNESERQHCALWIKKLSDPATCGSSLNGHNNRNLYARLLLHMLRRGVLEGPFASKPEPGNLRALPTYMSIYFDEPINGRPVDHCKATLPDWVTGELVGCTNDSLAAGLPKNTSTPHTAYFSQLSKEKTPRGGATASSPLKHSPRHEARAGDGGRMSPDDSDLEARLNSWNLRVENPRYLREKVIPLSPICKPSFVRSSTTDEVDLQLLQSKEVDMRVKILESKHLEEKLKMQQRHDVAVDKILDRKNVEIEELTTLFRAQQKESEEMIHKLERKVQSMLKESTVICESKDTQIAELKKMTDQSADSLKNEFERKLHAVVAEMEKEKFELQKKHSDNIQELLENTKIRLAKMESEYNARSQSTMQIVCELEQQAKQQSVEVEKSNALCQKATQEKVQLEIHLASINVELQEANRRFMVLQKDKDEQSVLFEQTLQKFQAKHEADVNHLHKEHTLSVAKASEVMEDFEKSISELKQQLVVSEHQRQTQARDQDLKFQQEKDELQISYNAKVLALHSEVDKERTEDRRKTAKLEDAFSMADGRKAGVEVRGDGGPQGGCVGLVSRGGFSRLSVRAELQVWRDMEKQLDRTRESHRVQLQQAHVALEQFRRQVKLSSEKAETEMKLQMEKVEEDLQHSRCLRENQTKEFSQQLDAVRERFEQQMAEQRAKHEQERTRLQQQHCAEKERLVQERQREAGSLESQARAALEQHHKHSQEWRKRDGQTISNLEAQLARSREELHLARVQHKQQLAALREEDKQKAHLDKEASIKRLCSDMEGIRSDLERSHQQEKDAAEEKTTSKLKHMEKEYSHKLARSAQIIGELQQSLCNSKEEVVSLQQTMKRQLEEAEHGWAQERKEFNQQANQANKVMVELQQSVCSSNEEAVSLQQTLKRQLEEARQGWLQERRTITQQAHQANKDEDLFPNTNLVCLESQLLLVVVKKRGRSSGLSLRSG
ncbi:centrosomal protein of 112 kDa-like isoform X2 [Entelurus aequoreus]|uniref:centrosomal protein of 112 kDa-like isoform X2 n=1 Tax=Entelurus aequoreus TaxID=161455 RepID=UPI002B1D5758|nr:centrosomal protein of 112 kDa-like isoform X2 [Entelurus aequoreus]